MSERGRIQLRNVGSYLRRTLCPRDRNGNLSTGPWRLCATRSAGHAEADCRACHCLSWLVGGPGHRIGFRGGRPLLERPGRTQKLRLKAIDKGEKLFERFTWLGALAATGPLSGIHTVPVPTFVFASIVALLPSPVHRGHAIRAALPPQLSSRGGGVPPGVVWL